MWTGGGPYASTKYDHPEHIPPPPPPQPLPVTEISSVAHVLCYYFSLHTNQSAYIPVSEEPIRQFVQETDIDELIEPEEGVQVHGMDDRDYNRPSSESSGELLIEPEQFKGSQPLLKPEMEITQIASTLPLWLSWLINIPAIFFRNAYGSNLKNAPLYLSLLTQLLKLYLLNVDKVDCFIFREIFKCIWFKLSIWSLFSSLNIMYSG